MERTHRVASLGGVARAEYDFDDASGKVLRVRGTNDGPGTLRVRLFGTDTSGEARGWSREFAFAPHSGTTEHRVRGKRFDLEPDGRGPAGEGEPDYYPTLRGLATEASY